MQQFFKDNDVKIYHTNSHLKVVIIERFNRSLRELMMKEFVKNNNTVYYNILPKLIKIYNNRYHSTIKMSPIKVDKNNEKYIKENIQQRSYFVLITIVSMYGISNTSHQIRYKVSDIRYFVSDLMRCIANTIH